MRMTPLDDWSREKTGGMTMADWQLKKLRETITLARHSPFNRGRLPTSLPKRLDDIQKLPLMDAEDLVRGGLSLLCVSPQKIERIVTLRTSGTTGKAKRLHFTAEDLELTVDFFARGLPTVVEPGGVIAVMMPCNTPNGVGDLICRGLERIPAYAVRWGPLSSFADTAAMLQAENVTAIVGNPIQVFALMRYLAMTDTSTSLRSVLLSADNVPSVMVRELEARGLQVYKHFGMTETGYGCAIDCDAHKGQHIREPDLLVEILDPITGLPMPDGEWGEIVVTTLSRRGMPLIRYRTGDRSRILPGICPCGSLLRRLDDVRGRWKDEISLSGSLLTIPDMDEAIFELPQVMDYMPEIEPGTLRLHVTTFAGMKPLEIDEVQEALLTIPALNKLKKVIQIEPCRDYSPLHQAKRSFTILGG